MLCNFFWFVVIFVYNALGLRSNVAVRWWRDPWNDFDNADKVRRRLSWSHLLKNICCCVFKFGLIWARHATKLLFEEQECYFEKLIVVKHSLMLIANIVGDNILFIAFVVCCSRGHRHEVVTFLVRQFFCPARRTANANHCSSEFNLVG